MIPKPPEDITEQDLKQLVENRVCENRTLEFKRDLYGPRDEDKRELLEDVSAFANTAGGDLLIGVDEEAGAACGCEGVELPDADAETLRLENILRDGLAPRLQGCVVRAIPLSSGRKCVLIRAPHSWNRPHMVTFRGHDKFYGRAGAAKHRLDVTELRSAFVLSEAITQRIRAFRADRIIQLKAGETPVPTERGSLIAVHLMPIQSFDAPTVLSTRELSDLAHGMQLMGGPGNWRRPNVDGFAVYCMPKAEAYSYIQIFRSGAVEAVNTFMLAGQNTGDAPEEFHPVLYESNVPAAVKGYLTRLREHGVGFPVYVGVSFLGVKGRRIALRGERYAFFPDQMTPIPRDDLLPQEVVFQNPDEDAAALLKPSFDLVWNACGRPGSLHYDENGRWIG